MRRTLMLLLVSALLICSAAAPTSQPARAGEITIQDTPTTLVPSGVAGFTLASPKLFWYNGIPQCPPRLGALAAAYT